MGSRELRQGLDMLVGLPEPDLATARALPFSHQSMQVRPGVVRGIGLRYDVLFTTLYPDPLRCQSLGVRQ